MSSGDVHPDVFDSDDDLAVFAAELRAAAAATPEPVVRPELAQLFERGLPPVAARAAARSLRPRLVRRVAIAAGALVVGTGGLGVAGALPAPVQQAVADVAAVIGLELPEPDERSSDRRPAEAPPAPVPTPNVPPTMPDAPPSTVPATPPSTVPARPEPTTPATDEDERGRSAEKREAAEERQQASDTAGERSAGAGSRPEDTPAAGEEHEVPADERAADPADAPVTPRSTQPVGPAEQAERPDPHRRRPDLAQPEA